MTVILCSLVRKMKFSLPNLSSFFNRLRETKEITSALTFQKPQLTVMLGPPSSGKTALVNHITQQKKNNDPRFHPININLRSVDMSSSYSFYNTILKQLTSFNWNMPSYLSSVDLKVGDMGATANLKQSEIQLSQLLGAIESRIQTDDIWHGARPVVFVVDEANELKYMKNQEDLRSFLKFCVRISKEESKCHVVFTSSDSFFESWLKTRNTNYYFF